LLALTAVTFGKTSGLEIPPAQFAYIANIAKGTLKNWVILINEYLIQVFNSIPK
jgi:hypothetical protein